MFSRLLRWMRTEKKIVYKNSNARTDEEFFLSLLTCAASFYLFLMYFLYVTYFMLSLGRCAIRSLSLSHYVCAMKSSTLLLMPLFCDKLSFMNDEA